MSVERSQRAGVVAGPTDRSDTAPAGARLRHPSAVATARNRPGETRILPAERDASWTGEPPAGVDLRADAVQGISPTATWIGADSRGFAPVALPAELSGRYQYIEARQSSSPAGQVWLAGDGATPTVFVKLAGSDERVLTRVGTASRGLLRPLEWGRSGDGRFEVWPYLAQGTLRDLLRREGALPVPRCRTLLVDLADALAHLHKQEDGYVIHRDIKPENILLDGEEFKLTDFDISQWADSIPVRQPNHDRSDPYAAPETDLRLLFPASDYWSLGMVLLECLTGAHPWTESRLAGLRAGGRPRGQVFVGHDRYPASALAAVTDRDWRQLLEGLLKPDPDVRWGYAQVTAWLAGAAISAPVSTAQRSARQATARWLVGNWDSCAAKIIDGTLAAELSTGSVPDALSSEIGQLLDQGSVSADLRLLRLVYLLDPEMPPVWRGMLLEHEDLAALSVEAIRRGDQDARDLLDEVLRLRVLEEMAECSHGALRMQAELGECWRAAIGDWEQAWDLAARYGAPLHIRPDQAEAKAFLYLDANVVAEQQRIEAILAENRAARWPFVVWLGNPAAAEGRVSPGRNRALAYLATAFRERYPSHLVERCHYPSGTVMRPSSLRSTGAGAPRLDVSITWADQVLTVLDTEYVLGRRARIEWSAPDADYVRVSGFGRQKSNVGTLEFFVAEHTPLTVQAVAGRASRLAFFSAVPAPELTQLLRPAPVATFDIPYIPAAAPSMLVAAETIRAAAPCLNAASVLSATETLRQSADVVCGHFPAALTNSVVPLRQAAVLRRERYARRRPGRRPGGDQWISPEPGIAVRLGSRWPRLRRVILRLCPRRRSGT